MMMFYAVPKASTVYQEILKTKCYYSTNLNNKTETFLFSLNMQLWICIPLNPFNKILKAQN